jgi:hypothetical protein
VLPLLSLLTALALSLAPQPDVVEDRVDVVEFNTVLLVRQATIFQAAEARVINHKLVLWTDGKVRDAFIENDGVFWLNGNEVSWACNGRFYRVRYKQLSITCGDDSEAENQAAVPVWDRVQLGGRSHYEGEGYYE